MITPQIQNIVETTVKSCKPYFAESLFYLDREDFNQFIISGNDISSAVNHHRHDEYPVKVLRWFDDFWVYMKVGFVLNERSFPSTFLTISIFQGDSDDPIKNQLFRAEWDSYEDSYHPQPHWQVYPNKYHHKVYEDFEAFNQITNEEFRDADDNALNKLVDLRKVHFAMSAEWSKNGYATHKLSDVDILSNWLNGLLGEIQYQLKYASGT